MISKKLYYVMILAFSLVLAGLQGCSGMKSEDDNVIIDNVKAKLASDSTLSTANIDVDSDNGVVTLTGSVDTAAQEQSAISDASSVNGVKNVQSQLVIGGAANAAGAPENTGNTGNTGTTTSPGMMPATNTNNGPGGATGTTDNTGAGMTNNNGMGSSQMAPAPAGTQNPQGNQGTQGTPEVNNPQNPQGTQQNMQQGMPAGTQSQSKADSTYMVSQGTNYGGSQGGNNAGGSNSSGTGGYGSTDSGMQTPSPSQGDMSGNGSQGVNGTQQNQTSQGNANIQGQGSMRQIPDGPQD